MPASAVHVICLGMGFTWVGLRRLGASWARRCLGCKPEGLERLQPPCQHDIIAGGFSAWMGRPQTHSRPLVYWRGRHHKLQEILACRPLVNRAARICHGAAQEGQVLAPLDVVQNLLHELAGLQDFEVRRHQLGQGATGSWQRCR